MQTRPHYVTWELFASCWKLVSPPLKAPLLLTLLLTLLMVKILQRVLIQQPCEAAGSLSLTGVGNLRQQPQGAAHEATMNAALRLYLPLLSLKWKAEHPRF
jgi:hypothetical protein